MTHRQATHELLKQLTTAASALVNSIAHDESAHGGLITRATVRLSDELRVVLNRVKAVPQGNDDAPQAE